MRATKFLKLLAVLLLSGSASAAAGEPLARRSQNSAEPVAGIETEFGELRVTGGYRLRSIVTRPQGADRPLPGVYFVQWLSCDSVEITRAEDGWMKMLHTLVSESGMAVMRLEKAGVGDSEGGPCVALDYETELHDHREGVGMLGAHPWIDPERVFVFGASMGANLAPLLAEGARLRGVAVWGGGAQSWFERQLGLERRALELGGATGVEIDARMRVLSRVYAHVLLEGLGPNEIAAHYPELAGVWETATGAGSESQFGRPLAFHRQAQKRRWAEAWAKIDAPVLVLFGEYDWFEDVAGARLIGTVVNRDIHGGSRARAEVHVVPRMDHHFTLYASPAAAFAGEGGRPNASPVMDILLPWLKRHAE